ncbi:MAG TPA: SDR family NAD(P)-dependent oxidoreductase, partial [Armatimonadota bacterium]|nr:SDR family NAD(P)-dependent oxidoreductase [Armatimonadota bacterium]
MFDLHGKVSLVTGSSRGLGKGILLCLAKAGADVVLNFRSSENEANATIEQVRAMGRKAIAVKADVSKQDDVKLLFDKVMTEYGHLDILVNNAGTARPENIFEMTEESWRSLIDTNLTSTFLCSKYAMEIMREQKSGRIIQVSSIVGHRGAIFGHVHYAATKSGQLGFTKTLARTAAEYKITVNAIAPGVIGTELLYQTHGKEGAEDLA